MTDPLKELQILIDKYIKIAVLAQTVCDEYDARKDYGLFYFPQMIEKLKEALEELKDETRRT